MVSQVKSAGIASDSAAGPSNAANPGGAGVCFHPPEFRHERDEHLSFLMTVLTKRGRLVKSWHPDAPCEPYEVGWITGTKAAAELMQALEAGHHRASLVWEDIDTERCVAHCGRQAHVLANRDIHVADDKIDECYEDSFRTRQASAKSGDVRRLS